MVALQVGVVVVEGGVVAQGGGGGVEVGLAPEKKYGNIESFDICLHILKITRAKIVFFGRRETRISFITVFNYLNLRPLKKFNIF